MNIQKRLFFTLPLQSNDYYYYSKELTLLFSWLQYQHQLVSALSSSSRDQIRLFYDIHQVSVISNMAVLLGNTRAFILRSRTFSLLIHKELSCIRRYIR
jgi:hypothetical protein